MLIDLNNDDYGVTEQTMLDASILFNRILLNGVDVDEIDDSEFIQELFEKQADIALEECLEFVQHYGKDDVETLDAIADMYFTVPYLQKLHDHYWFGHCSAHASLKVGVCYHIFDEMKYLLNDRFSCLEMKNHAVAIACNRVIENNMSKFTTDRELFKTWESPDNEPLTPKTVVVDGVEYYCLVNEKGKVRKHKHFKNVELSDLLGKGV